VIFLDRSGGSLPLEVKISINQLGTILVPVRLSGHREFRIKKSLGCDEIVVPAGRNGREN
jgi:hypothetical protein